MNKLVAFALALAIANCQMPLRSAEAVSHIYHCGTGVLRGAWEKGYHNLVDEEGNLAPERDIKFDGKTFRYRNKKCRSVANIQMHDDVPSSADVWGAAATRFKTKINEVHPLEGEWYYISGDGNLDVDCRFNWRPHGKSTLTKCRPDGKMAVPAQYHGIWCAIGSYQEGKPQLYKRCREYGGEQDWIINARGTTNGEALCKPLAVVAVPGGHQVELVCQNESDTESPSKVRNRWRLLANGRRLEVVDQ
jgi:hypothetical protein